MIVYLQRVNTDWICKREKNAIKKLYSDVARDVRVLIFY